MKKILATMLALLLILGGSAALAGCSKRTPATPNQSSQSSSESAPQPETEPQPSQPSAAPKEQSQMVEYTQEEAAANNKAIGDGDFTLVQLQKPAADAVTATIKTNKGDIKVVLFPQQAPKAVENFVTHAKAGYYNGLSFHKVVNGFLIQSGDPTGTGVGGQSIYQDDEGKPVEFEDEFSLDLWHFRGALAMHNPNRPNANGSQFYIVQSKTVAPDTITEMKEGGYPERVIEQYDQLGGIPGRDWIHTVFGMVFSGMEVVDDIAIAPTDQDDKPTQDIIITSITVANA